MGEVKTWNHFSRHYEKQRYKSIMYVCILKCQDWSCGINDFFSLWRRSCFFSGRLWFPLLQKFPLWLCPDVGALSVAVRSTWGMRNIPFNKVRAKTIALCFTSLLLMHYHCASTMEKQKVWVSTCRHQLFGLFHVYLLLWISLLDYIVLCWKISLLVPSSIAGVNL